MSKLFKNKNVIITGATGGLGSSLAYAFTQLGANLLLIGRNQDKLQSLGEELCSLRVIDQVIDTICMDFYSNDIEERIKSAFDKLSSIDVLINNAATHGPVGTFWENDFTSWENAYHVNFTIPFILMRMAVPKMMAINKGKIINVAGGGATSSRPGFSSYAIAKTSLVRFTEIAADELRLYNIDVNIVSPGTMPTNLLKDILNYSEEIVGKKEIDSVKKTIKEGGSMNKAKDLCVFLASDFSNGITGKLISAVWDPWQNLEKYKEELLNSDIYTLRRIVPEDRNQKWE